MCVCVLYTVNQDTTWPVIASSFPGVVKRFGRNRSVLIIEVSLNQRCPDRDDRLCACLQEYRM